MINNSPGNFLLQAVFEYAFPEVINNAILLSLTSFSKDR